MNHRTDLLAEALSDRLEYLGWTYGRLAEASRPHDPRGTGLSESGIAKIARGELSQGPQSRTTRVLEDTLEWPQGTVRKILRGDVPPAGLPFRRDVETSEPTPPPAVATIDLAALQQQLADLADLQRILRRLVGLEVPNTLDVAV